MITVECVELAGETISSNYHLLKKVINHFMENLHKVVIRMLETEIFLT